MTDLVIVDLVDGPAHGLTVEIHEDALAAWGGTVTVCQCGDGEEQHDCPAGSMYRLDGPIVDQVDGGGRRATARYEL